MKLSKLCKTCGKEFEVSGSRKYCSDECFKQYHTKEFVCEICGTHFWKYAHGKTEYKTCSRKCSGKLAYSKHDGLTRESTKLKSKISSKENHHIPSVRGGNGKGVTEPQRILKEALGKDWIYEYAQGIKGPRNIGYPPNYKIDIANLDLMIAIEVDGHSHNSLKRKEQDKKKENKLKDLGWTVIRFRNEDVLNDLERCVDKVCFLMD